MALFSLCKKLSLSHPLKLVYSEFHTLRRLENFSFIKRNSVPITPKRNFFWIFKKRTKREIRAKDQPPDSYELIYRNGIDHYLLSYEWTDQYTESLDTDKRKVRPVQNQLLGIYACFIITVGVLYLVTSRMPVRIYYHPQRQRYLMYFYGPIPNQIKKEIIKVSEIRPMSDTSPYWSDVTYQHISGKKLILMDSYFRHPADLYIMLGVQKDPNVEGYEKVKDKK